MTQFHYHYHHKHKNFDLLARSVSGFTAALTKVSSVSQFCSFLVEFSGMILKGFCCVAFFAFIYHVQYAFSL
jgi:hypothetical protein